MFMLYTFVQGIVFMIIIIYRSQVFKCTCSSIDAFRSHHADPHDILHNLNLLMTVIIHYQIQHVYMLN